MLGLPAWADMWTVGGTLQFDLSLGYVLHKPHVTSEISIPAGGGDGMHSCFAHPTRWDCRSGALVLLTGAAQSRVLEVLRKTLLWWFSFFLSFLPAFLFFPFSCFSSSLFSFILNQISLGKLQNLTRRTYFSLWSLGIIWFIRSAAQSYQVTLCFMEPHRTWWKTNKLQLGRTNWFILGC